MSSAPAPAAPPGGQVAPPTSHIARRMVWVGFATLFILHHDFWFWDDPTLVFGFLPVGLAWHAGFSLAASGLWLLAVKFAWPAMVDEVSEQYKSSPD